MRTMHEHFFNFRVRYFINLYELTKQKETIHTCDVAKQLQVSLPAASIMLRKLMDEGYIVKPSFQQIAFSKKGYELAQTYYNQYLKLITYFSKIPDFQEEDQIESSIICLGAFPEARIMKMLNTL